MMEDMAETARANMLLQPDMSRTTDQLEACFQQQSGKLEQVDVDQLDNIAQLDKLTDRVATMESKCEEDIFRRLMLNQAETATIREVVKHVASQLGHRMEQAEEAIQSLVDHNRANPPVEVSPPLLDRVNALEVKWQLSSQPPSKYSPAPVGELVTKHDAQVKAWKNTFEEVVARAKKLEMSAHQQRMEQLTEASIEEVELAQQAETKTPPLKARDVPSFVARLMADEEAKQQAATLAANASHAEFVSSLLAAKEAEKAQLKIELAAISSHVNQNETSVDLNPAVGGNSPPLVLCLRTADTAPQQARWANEESNVGGGVMKTATTQPQMPMLREMEMHAHSELMQRCAI
jgi:hypothetical protein